MKRSERKRSQELVEKEVCAKRKKGETCLRKGKTDFLGEKERDAV